MSGKFRVWIGLTLLVISSIIIATVVGLKYGRRRPGSVTEYGGKRARKGDLIFADDFDKFDMSTWDHEITMSGGGNWEFQLYDNNRSNSYVKHGKVFIKPTLTSDTYGEDFITSGTLDLNRGANRCTDSSFFGCSRTGTIRNPLNPVTSARIHTRNSFSFKYGIVEARMKLPMGEWLWPALWLLPKNNTYGTWPASGEIDIMESRGNIHLTNAQGVNIGSEQFAATLHYGPSPRANGWPNAHFEHNLPRGKSYNDDFHRFGLEWTPSHIRFSIDGDTVGEIVPDEGGFWGIGRFSGDAENPWRFSENPKMAPFDQEFYLIMNLAIGGTNGYFPDDVQQKKPWRNNSPNAFKEFWESRSEWYPTWKGEEAALQVDYVRVWAL